MQKISHFSAENKGPIRIQNSFKWTTENKKGRQVIWQRTPIWQRRQLIRGSSLKLKKQVEVLIYTKINFCQNFWFLSRETVLLRFLKLNSKNLWGCWERRTRWRGWPRWGRTTSRRSAPPCKDSPEKRKVSQIGLFCFRYETCDLA